MTLEDTVPKVFLSALLILFFPIVKRRHEALTLSVSRVLPLVYLFGSFTVPLSLLFESLSLYCLFFFVGSAVLNSIAASIVVGTLSFL